MVNNKFCPNCGRPLSDNAKFCHVCGIEIKQSPNVTISRTESTQNNRDIQRDIKTIEDMANYLEELSQQANESVGAALQAQLQVIRYIQSPKLYDSSFDLFFKNIKNALKYADSPRMQTVIQERAAIMIQNYVFFMNAKLQFEVEVNRDEYRELMEESCKMLAESTAEVAAIAIPGGTVTKTALKAALAKASVKMLTSKDDKGDNLFVKIHRWWTKDTRTKEKQGEFLQTMDTLTAKLYKHRGIIGKSDLIAGVIDRYSLDMAQYFYGGAVAVAKNNCVQIKQDTTNKVKQSMWIILSLNILVLMARWLFKGVGSGISYVSAQISETEYVVDKTHWALNQWGIAFALFAVITLALLIRYRQKKKRYDAELEDAEKKYNDQYQTYYSIARTFDE